MDDTNPPCSCTDKIRRSISALFNISRTGLTPMPSCEARKLKNVARSEGVSSFAAQPASVAPADSDLRAKLAEYKLLPQNDSDVLWNFEKFLVDRNGQVIQRFAPDVAPDAPMLIAAIEAALS